MLKFLHNFCDFVTFDPKIEKLQQKLNRDKPSSSEASSSSKQKTKMSSMNDIIKAVQKHEVEAASQAIDKLVEKIHEVLGEQDADLLESLEQYLSDIVTSVKDDLKEESKKAAKVAAGKKVKDPNAPKRPPSEYNIFIKDHIAELRKDHTDAKPKELMSMAVAAWNEHKAKVGAIKGAGKAATKAAVLPDSDDEADSDGVEVDMDSKKKGAAGSSKKGGKK